LPLRAVCRLYRYKAIAIVAIIATIAIMNPAQAIISKLGGPNVVSSVVGIHRTRVSNWQRPRAKGGTDGLIPQGYHLKLIDYAASQGIVLTADDFLPVRQESAA